MGEMISGHLRNSPPIFLETHHGSVRVKSTAKDGTTFTVEMPNDTWPFQEEINKVA
ncbi:MAG: sensor histidine kinase [Methylotenera sp.]|nr:sensor histidine kinase [Oligoflexia bacterium]